MGRTNVEVDDDACAAVMKRYRLATKREAVNFALRSLASEPFSIEEARRMRGTGWDGDLDEMRGRGGDDRQQSGRASHPGRHAAPGYGIVSP